ncbi:ent-kaurene oxidase [Zopfia rhizophila CBS 207.26]|uniref:Ent-kaurene oxidase n=1 Tax=Zopfia rhizophila CBS 207.26 TaxID=1314779 RepID=A0A6A6DE72_9PEZI|nr:ent-kaurene oxidase [Zopfia rhizophila CBS 207.26]
MALLENGTTLLVIPSVVLLFLFPLANALFSSEDPKFWSSQPSVGVGRGSFGWIIGTLQSITKTYEWAFEGYEKFSKCNVPYVLPSVERGAVVVIPPQQIMKAYGHPESILDMTWNLTKLTPRIAEDLAVGYEKCFGKSTGWKDVVVWDSCLKIVSGASNGAFCGAPLCRDEGFLQDLRDHSTYFIPGAMAINATPRLLQPLTGALVGWGLKYIVVRCLKRCLPVIKERLEKTAQLKADPSFDWTIPSDGLQWLIDEAYAVNNPAQLEPRRIAYRLLVVNDVSFLSTSATVQNLLLDLASSDPSRGYIQALRDECDQVLKEARGTWTKDAVSRLKLVDSVIRESMRLTPFGTFGLPRRVDHNIRIPQNTNVFSNIASRDDASRKPKPKSSVTLDDSFLGFGFGKHACPGRFFALNEMKLFVAYLVQHYDIEHLKERPKPVNVMWYKFPSDKATIRVRRRQGA